MKSDIEVCVRAGCDELISKPIQQDTLSRLLVRYLRPTAAQGKSGGPIKSALLVEEPTLIDLVREFVGRLPGSVKAVRDAHEARDEASLIALVHALKGSSGNFGYAELLSLCQAIEFEIAKASEHGIARLLANLDDMVVRITAGLPTNVLPILREVKDA